MSIDILMPALSPTMEEGTLAKWHVKVGDTVKSGDVIAEIETDKATMEVEAVDEGTIAQLLIEEGSEGVKVNAVIAVLAEEGEDAASVTAPGAAPVKAASAAPAAAASTKSHAQPASAAPAHKPDGDRIKASPLAKRVAAQRGLDLSTIDGSGPHGRIVLRDVEHAKPSARAATTAASVDHAPTKAVSAPVAQPPAVRDPLKLGIAEGSYDLIALDGMRKTIAKRMTESFRDVPHFPLTVNLEIDNLLAQRKRLNDRLGDDGVKISVNDILIRASALALKKVPAANASYSPEGILYHHHADVAVAVAIEGGLITPIIRKAEAKGLAAISAEMKDLAQRARDRKLMPEEFQGGTFSISNLGMFGITSFASILNEPQGMIMSVGAGEQRPVVKDGALAIATVMTVTLTCDHRVVDGAIGAEFISLFRRYVEDPEMMLV
jgi:pyruvate dehydrogenase E2 component (dihydrolipoamide acetyltransferase)